MTKRKHSQEYTFNVQRERPEENTKGPLEHFTSLNVRKYADSKSLMKTQEKITHRIMELADMKLPGRVLDLGMGCGFAGTTLIFEGYSVTGVDLNREFLTYYDIPLLNSVQADLRFPPYRMGAFQYIISVSAIQWLFTTPNDLLRTQELTQLAEVCALLLVKRGKLVFQFYPKNDDQMHELGHAFLETGQFEGGFMIDNPHSSKKRKIYLVLEHK